MRAVAFSGLAILAAILPLSAASSVSLGDPLQARRSGGYLQCVPYARSLTGIRIHGDAHTWWKQAEGRYARGDRPRVGAVMNLRPAGNSRLGHVAAVSEVIDARTILISHANWSRRGGIERNVRAVDVSPDNDWSQVRVWYGPAGKLGARHWPLYGFIYPEKPGKIRKPRTESTRLAAVGEAKPVGKRITQPAKPAPAPRLARPLANDPIGSIIAKR